MSKNLLEDNALIVERKQKLERIKTMTNQNGYPNDWRPTHFAKQLFQQYHTFSKEELEEKKEIVCIAGRIMAKRGPFLVLKDHEHTIQAYASKEVQKELKSIGGLDIGDIIGVKGALDKSGKGDLYVNMESYQLITKSLRPLPEKYHGLVDQELKYRQRYVDLIMNDKTKHVFIIRSKLIAEIRSFMIKHDFIEVETPMMQAIPGGASAKPFITHHNALNQQMYLRIAPELYLKRLIVGGFNKVFEINRNFRNEGLSTRHNPEFTMMEFYWSYANYHDLMHFTEKLLQTIIQNVLQDTTIEYGEWTFNFAEPFERLSMKDSILKYCSSATEKHLQDFEHICQLADQLHIKREKNWQYGRLLTEIFEQEVEEKLITPTFITEYPAEVSPLSRRNDQNPDITDRFELFIGGKEIANGFSELNDAEDQQQRFLDQVKAKEAGDEEAMFFDEDYITALEYGMPPTAGQGIGIDRLIMFLTDCHTIKDVILFPTLRHNIS